MQKPGRHILVCGSFRAQGSPQGVCHKKGAISLIQYLQTELSDRGMDDVMVSMTGCLKVCDRGPAMVIYPDNVWYGGLDESKIDEILDALENDETVENYLIT
ncbi:MAG: (2Fe-2S) ferredoxin domain-containing protein [Chitinispirillaceae bacterium]